MRHSAVESAGSGFDAATAGKRRVMLIVLIAVTVGITTAIVEALYIVAWLVHMVATITWPVALGLAVAANGVLFLASWLAVTVLRPRINKPEVSLALGPEQVGDIEHQQITGSSTALEVLARRFLPLILEVLPFGHRSAR